MAELAPFSDSDIAGTTFRAASESWEKQANERARTEALRQQMAEHDQTLPTRLRRMEADTGLAEEHLTQTRMKPLTDVLDLIPKDPQAAKILATQGGFADKIPSHVWENADAAQGMSNAMKFGEKRYPGDAEKLQEWLTKTWYPAAMDFQAKGLPLSDPRLPLMAGQQPVQRDEYGVPQAAPPPSAQQSPANFRWNKEGTAQEPIPGGLASPEYVTQLTEAKAGPTLGAPALEGAAERYFQTGKFPPNTGKGIQGAREQRAIQARAAEMAEERGVDVAELPKRWQKFESDRTGLTRFMSGPLGDRTRALNVAVDHVGTLQRLSEALQNGNMQVFNRLAQAWAEQTGSPAPTNFDAAKQIVGTEIMKALVNSGAGGVAERAELQSRFSRANSPAQLSGVINDVVRPLLTGQLRGLRQQFPSATGLPAEKFDEMLLPSTRQFLGGEGAAAQPGGQRAAGTQAPSKTMQPPPEAIDLLKKNPQAAGQFDVVFGPGSAARELQGRPSGGIFGANESIIGGGSGEPKYATGGVVGLGGDDLADEMADAALRGDQSVFSYLRTAKGSKGEARVRQRIHELGKARGISDEQLAQQDQFACGGVVGNQRYASGGTTGPVTGSDPGRADTRRKTVPKGAFIIPADVVAITGQGNSKAGLGMLKRKFRVGRYADGGGVGNEIQVSDGELVLSPREAAGAGGSEALIRWINRVRRDEIARLQSAPQPHHGGTHFDDGGDDGDGEGADAEADADGDGVGDSEDGFDDTGESSTDGIDAEGNAADANMDGVNDVTGDPIGGFEAAAGTTSTAVDDPMGAFGQATPEELETPANNTATNTTTTDPTGPIDLEPIEVNTAHGVAGNASSPGTSSGPGAGTGIDGGVGFGGPDLGTDFNVDAGANGFWDTDALTQGADPLIAPTAPSPANPLVTPTPNNPAVPFFSVPLPPITVQAPRSSPAAPPGPPSRSGGPTGGIFGPNESIIGWDPAPSPAPDLALLESPGLSFSDRSGSGNAFDPAYYGAPDALAGVSPGVAPGPGLAFTDRGGFDLTGFTPSSPAFAPDPVAPSVAQAPAPAAPAYSPAYSPAYAPATPSFSTLTPSNMPTYAALTPAGLGAGDASRRYGYARGGLVGRPRPARWLREA